MFDCAGFFRHALLLFQRSPELFFNWIYQCELWLYQSGPWVMVQWNYHFSMWLMSNGRQMEWIGLMQQYQYWLQQKMLYADWMSMQQGARAYIHNQGHDDGGGYSLSAGMGNSSVTNTVMNNIRSDDAKSQAWSETKTDWYKRI